MMYKNQIYQIILFLILILLLTTIASSRPDYSVKESRNCPYCHLRDGPPQLNEIGEYYGTHNHSMEGYVPLPKATPTPEPTKEIEIGVHMDTWDVGLQALLTILFMLAVVYIIRL